MLAQILENPHEQRRYRAVAAIALGHIATTSAEDILLRNLKKTEDETLSTVLLALGHIGGRRGLAAIDALKLDPQHPAFRTTAYAATLIAHRLGLPGHEIPFPGEANLIKLPATKIRPIEFTSLEPKAARKVLDALKQHPYGIAFNPAKLTRIQCAGETNVVCPNREFLGTSAIKLGKRKAVVALGALLSTETDDYSVSYVVFARPASGKGNIEIMVHRCSGALALAGTGRVVGARIEFELRSVRRPGALAIYLRGQMEDGRIAITKAVSSTTREKRLKPATMVVPVQGDSKLGSLSAIPRG